jgi:hypothetical protein
MIRPAHKLVLYLIISDMIHEVLGFLKEQLNQYLRNQNSFQEDRVVFMNGERSETVAFPKNAITPLLINLEEENVLRQSDPYIQIRKDGSRVGVNPEIRVNLFVLFVSNFNAYEESLKYLSYIIKYFQSNRVFTHDGFPLLSENVDRLIMELVTMPFTSQNEIWNALRTTYVPSVLYKVKMIVFEDENPRVLPAMQEVNINIGPY